MKNVVLVLGLLFLLFSCETEKQKPPLKKVKEEKKYHKLSIVVDALPDSSDFYNSRLFLSDIEYSTKKYHFDTITQKTIYEWDSLPTGNYVFNTIFHKDQMFSFTISKDTIIKIKNKFGFEYVNKFDKKVFLEADTIEILYTEHGCEHYYLEKSILLKDKSDSKYSISTHFNKYKSLKQKKAFPDIIDAILLVQNELLQTDNSQYSTTEKYFHILVDKKMYYNRRYYKNLYTYIEFKKKYITIE